MHHSPQPPRQDLAIPLPHLLCSLTDRVFQMEHSKYFRLAPIRYLLCKELIDRKPLGACRGCGCVFIVPVTLRVTSAVQKPLVFEVTLHGL